MGPTDKKRIDNLVRSEVERDEIGDFERQFRDPNNISRLREDLKVEEVFEKAGFVPTDWGKLSPTARSWIQGKRARGAFGISARPWETGFGYHIFEKPGEASFYFIKKSGSVYSWSRMWFDGNEFKIEPIDAVSTLTEVIGTLAYHEGRKQMKPLGKVVETSRVEAQTVLARNRWKK